MHPEMSPKVVKDKIYTIKIVDGIVKIGSYPTFSHKDFCVMIDQISFDTEFIKITGTRYIFGYDFDLSLEELEGIKAKYKLWEDEKSVTISNYKYDMFLGEYIMRWCNRIFKTKFRTEPEYKTTYSCIYIKELQNFEGIYPTDKCFFTSCNERGEENKEVSE